MAEHSTEISRLKEQIESLEKLRGALDEGVIAAKLSELNRQLDQLIQTQGGAYVAGDVNTRGGDFVGHDKITYNMRLTYQTIERSKVELAEQQDKRELTLLADSLIGYVQNIEDIVRQTNTKQDSGNPYRGLRNYELEHTNYYYGRSTAIKDLGHQIEINRLTILHAGSGAGKTSLLKAGIFPYLLEEAHIPLYLRPYSTPVDLEIKRKLHLPLAKMPGLAQASLLDFLSDVTNLLLGKKLFILIDQFEELFTKQTEQGLTQFIDQLSQNLDAVSSRVHWVFSIRTEWFGQLSKFSRLRNLLGNNYLLLPFTLQEAKEVVIEPAKRRHVNYEQALVDRMLTDLESMNKGAIDTPSLQLVCSTLYKKSIGDTEITIGIYKELGGAEGILEQHLSSVLGEIKGEKNRDFALRVLWKMYNSERQLVRWTKDKLYDSIQEYGTREDFEYIWSIFHSNHLLREVESEDGRGPAYELVHEFLVTKIKEDPIENSRKAAQELLNRELAIYDQHNILIDPNTMAVLKPWLTRLDLVEDAKSLIKKSEDAQRRNRLVNFVGRLVAFLGTVLGISIVGYLAIYIIALGLPGVNLNYLVWIVVVPFAILGLLRGWVKESLIAVSVVVALFFIYILDLTIFKETQNISALQYMIRGVLIIFMTVIGYQLIRGSNRAQRYRIQSINDRFLGLIMGMLNGYLVAGSLIYFFYNYLQTEPILMISTEVNSPLIDLLPPGFLLTSPIIYIAVAIVIITAVVALI